MLSIHYVGDEGRVQRRLGTTLLEPSPCVGGVYPVYLCMYLRVLSIVCAQAAVRKQLGQRFMRKLQHPVQYGMFERCVFAPPQLRGGGVFPTHTFLGN